VVSADLVMKKINDAVGILAGEGSTTKMLSLV
jgi:hypothetical protein